MSDTATLKPYQLRRLMRLHAYHYGSASAREWGEALRFAAREIWDEVKTCNAYRVVDHDPQFDYHIVEGAPVKIEWHPIFSVSDYYSWERTVTPRRIKVANGPCVLTFYYAPDGKTLLIFRYPDGRTR
jgi:hypothetical protein